MSVSPPLAPAVRHSVFITFDFVGFHRWPQAPSQVDYLSSRHRHLFKVKMSVGVDDTNREIEYHMLKREVLTRMWLTNQGGGRNEFELGASSCEVIADWLLNIVREIHPSQPWYDIEVNEDGENGSTATWAR